MADLIELRGENFLLTKNTYPDHTGNQDWDLISFKASLVGSPNVSWEAWKFGKDDFWTVEKYGLAWEGRSALEALEQAIRATY